MSKPILRRARRCSYEQTCLGETQSPLSLRLVRSIRGSSDAVFCSHSAPANSFFSALQIPCVRPEVVYGQEVQDVSHERKTEEEAIEEMQRKPRQAVMPR